MLRLMTDISQRQKPKYNNLNKEFKPAAPHNFPQQTTTCIYRMLALAFILHKLSLVVAQKATMLFYTRVHRFNA